MGPLASICAVAAVSTLGHAPRPVSPERLEELLQKLREPTWMLWDGQTEAPRNNFPPVRGFRPQFDAILALERVGPATAGPLLELVADITKHPQARANAAHVLSIHLAGTWTGPDPAVLEAVRAAVKDPDPAVRVMALMGLGMRGENRNLDTPGAPPTTRTGLCPEARRVLVPVIAAALADPDGEVAHWAAATLADHARPGEWVPELLAALKREEPEVRVAALGTLGQVGRGTPAIPKAVLDRFDAAESTVRVAAIRAAARGWPQDPAALRAVLKQLDNKDDAQPYLAAVTEVGRFGPLAQAAVPKLVELMNDKGGWDFNHALRAPAVWSLGQIGLAAKAAAPNILEFAREPNSIGGHLRAVEALAKIDPAAAEQAREEEREKTEAFRRRHEEDERRRLMMPPVLPGIGPVRPPK